MRRRGTRRTRRRRAAAWIALVLLAVLVVAAWTVALSRPGAGTAPARDAAGSTTTTERHAGGSPGGGSPPAATSAPTTAAATPVTGVYAGPGALSGAVAADQALSDGFRYALDFLSGSSWTTITDPSWLSAQWRGGPFQLVVGVPMLPTTGATLAAGATGVYDGQFSLLAQRLVQDGLSSAVLMIGWDPADAAQPWYVATAAAARSYVQFWDHIHQVMGAVSGAHFTFEWVVGGDTSPVSPAAMYPGSSAVDLIGAVVFDRSTPRRSAAATRWGSLLGQRGGPAWAASFARSVRRPLAVAMWGVVPASTGGGGDDPAFVAHLLSWERAEHVRISILWDYGNWAITGAGFPAAEAALGRALAPKAPPVAASAARSVTRR